MQRPPETDVTPSPSIPNRPKESLGRKQRLTRSSLFEETYAQGYKWAGRYMIFWRREGDNAGLRLGVVASRRVGDAVRRARAKRRLREAFRRHRYLFSGPYDVVLVARQSLLSAPWPEVVEDLLTLARKAGLAKL